jgi:peptidoglycan L-alanyl-D-glutamate endopeptidase CwlK
MPKFTFGQKSLRELEGVNPRLVALVHRALELSELDFGVTDGLRTREEQQALLESGASQTLNSKHLTGDAVDLVGYVNGKPRFEFIPACTVAAAIRKAAKEMGVALRWGCAWDINFTDSVADPETLMEGYIARRKAAGKKPFLDSPHFELI